MYVTNSAKQPTIFSTEISMANTESIILFVLGMTYGTNPRIIWWTSRIRGIVVCQTFHQFVLVLPGNRSGLKFILENVQAANGVENYTENYTEKVHRKCKTLYIENF